MEHQSQAFFLERNGKTFAHKKKKKKNIHNKKPTAKPQDTNINFDYI